MCIRDRYKALGRDPALLVVKSARGLSIKAGALLIRTVWGTKLAGLRRVWSRQGDVTDKKNENEKGKHWRCG